MRYIPNRALVVSGAALATAAAMLLLPANPAAAAKPQVSITSGPTVTDNSVSLGYSINRWPRAIRSRVCTLDTATTHAFVSCGTLTKPAANPTTVPVTLTGLADGTHTFTVKVRFKNGRHAAATSAPFTTETGPVSTCWDNTLISEADLLYDGRINTQGNAGFTASTDGTCSGPTQFVRTVVQAPDVPTANNLCLSLGRGTVAGTLNSFGYNTAPADVWLCSGFS